MRKVNGKIISFRVPKVVGNRIIKLGAKFLGSTQEMKSSARIKRHHGSIYSQVP